MLTYPMPEDHVKYIKLETGHITHKDNAFEIIEWPQETTEFLTFEGVEEFPHFDISHAEGSGDAESEMFAVFFELSDHQILYSREVFSFMDLLRDLGGLRGALMWVILARTHAYSRIWF